MSRKDFYKEYPPSKDGAFIPTFKIQLPESRSIERAAKGQLQLSAAQTPRLKDEESQAAAKNDLCCPWKARDILGF